MFRESKSLHISFLLACVLVASFTGSMVVKAAVNHKKCNGAKVCGGDDTPLVNENGEVIGHCNTPSRVVPDCAALENASCPPRTITCHQGTYICTVNGNPVVLDGRVITEGC